MKDKSLQEKYDELYQWHVEIQCGKRAEKLFSQRLLESKIKEVDELKAELETYKKALRQCVKSVLSYEYQQFGSACQDEELFVIHNTQGYIDEYVKKAKEE